MSTPLPDGFLDVLVRFERHPYKAVLDYGRLGWSVIPIESRGKRPLSRWQVYQYRRADTAKIAEWFRRWPDANIAVVTGIVSNLVVWTSTQDTAQTPVSSRWSGNMDPSPRPLRPDLAPTRRRMDHHLSTAG